MTAMTHDDVGRRIMERLAAEGLIPLAREPRWRYFQKGAGPLFCWTVEKVDGRYISFVYKPVGKGSRSGKAEQWQISKASMRRHAKRKDAKARALRLFQESNQAATSGSTE